jgi:hypothetical protein
MERKKPSEPNKDYNDEETDRRAREAIARSFTMPYKRHKELVGTTQRARARKRKPKGSPKFP